MGVTSQNKIYHLPIFFIPPPAHFGQVWRFDITAGGQSVTQCELVQHSMVQFETLLHCFTVNLTQTRLQMELLDLASLLLEAPNVVTALCGYAARQTAAKTHVGALRG